MLLRLGCRRGDWRDGIDLELDLDGIEYVGGAVHIHRAGDHRLIVDFEYGGLYVDRDDDRH